MNLKEYEKITPSLAIKKEWDKEKNQAESLESLTYGSHKKVWWICKQGHSWQASVKDRLLKNEGCPYCKNRKVLSGFNDLNTLFPQLALSWDETKNDSLDASKVTAGSEKKVWWKCELGHSWQATIENRARKGQGCPYCTGKKAWPGFNDLVTLYPKLSKEWDREKNEGSPDTIRPGSGKIVWWKCKEGHSWQARVFSRTGKKKAGCPVCAGNQKKGKREPSYQRMLQEAKEGKQEQREGKE